MLARLFSDEDLIKYGWEEDVWYEASPSPPKHNLPFVHG